MTRRADQLFMQEQLRDLQITEPAFTHGPALLGSQPETPDQDQYDSVWEDAEEDKGDAMSMLDAKLNASTGKETDASGHLHYQLIVAAKGIAPCVGSVIELTENSANQETDD